MNPEYVPQLLPPAPADKRKKLLIIGGLGLGFLVLVIVAFILIFNRNSGGGEVAETPVSQLDASLEDEESSEVDDDQAGAASEDAAPESEDEEETEEPASEEVEGSLADHSATLPTGSTPAAPASEDEETASSEEETTTISSSVELTPPPAAPTPNTPLPEPEPDQGRPLDVYISVVDISSTPSDAPATPPTPEPVGDDIDSQYPLVSQRVKDLAAAVKLSNVSKHILYKHNPLLVDNVEDIVYLCAGEEEVEGFLQGCWKKVPRRMYILDDTLVEVTLVHELLHAIYYENYGGEVKPFIENQINIVIHQQPEKTTAVLEPYNLDTLDAPAHFIRWLKYNELHSFLGSEFTSLPQELEDYYSLYLLERSVVADLHATWKASWDAKIADYSQLRERYADQRAEYDKCVAAIGADNCDQYDLYDEYVAFSECLISTFFFYSECVPLNPVATPYE